MSWAAIGGAVVGVVGNAVVANNNKAPAQAAAPTIGQTATEATQANIQNLPDIQALLRQTNAFQSEEQQSLLNKTIPGWDKLSESMSSLAQESLDDPYSLPQDVQDMLTKQAAERGVAAGTRGQFNDFSLLKDLGVNSLAYGSSRISQAQSLLGSIASISGSVNPMSPLSFFATTGQATGVSQTNQSAEQAALNAQQAAANVNNANLWGSVVGLGQTITSNVFKPSSTTSTGADGATVVTPSS